MGNVTLKSGIWTPDEDDKMAPDVWSASMAQSIEDGIGVRLEKQETRVSLRATAPEPFNVVGTSIADAYVMVPLTVGGVTGSRAPDPDYAGGNHAQGITIAGNIVTIVTDGLYTLTGQATIYNGGGAYAPHSWDFYGTLNGATFGLPSYGATNALSFTGGFLADTRQLVAGDQIALMVGVGTDHVGGFRVQDALLSVALQYAA